MRNNKELSHEQNMLHEIFCGKSFWGLPEDNLPKMDGVLTSGGGLIKNGDRGDTKRLFGL